LESGPRLLCLVLFIVRASFKGERGRGSVCSFSILYRISLFPFPFTVASVFYFLFKKICVGFLFCFSARCVTYMSTFSFASLFTHCSRKETSRLLVVPYAYHTVSYYITIRISPTQRPTSLFTQIVTVRRMYSRDQATAMYRAYGITVY
jgi:hypothetical protein